MVISKTEAAAALSEIARTTDRSNELKGYQKAGPVFILWGVIWVIGYTAMGVLAPQHWGWVWLPLDVVGLVGTVALLRRQCEPAGKGELNKVLLTVLAIAAFAFGVTVLFEARSNNTYLAFPALLAGAVYFAVGLGRAPRMLVIGALMFAATLVGFHFFAPWLAFWLAAVGGGGLIVGGLWLRRA